MGLEDRHFVAEVIDVQFTASLFGLFRSLVQTTFLKAITAFLRSNVAELMGSLYRRRCYLAWISLLRVDFAFLYDTGFESLLAFDH